jgi:hypothetical protein
MTRSLQGKTLVITGASRGMAWRSPSVPPPTAPIS